MSQEREQHEAAPREPAQTPAGGPTQPPTPGPAQTTAGEPTQLPTDRSELAELSDPVALAELSALADGTLDRTRAEAVRARIEGSPHLAQLLERERTAVAALRAARERDRAPQALRAALQRQSAYAPAPFRRRLARAVAAAGSVLTGAGGALLATATAAAVVAILLIALPGAAPGGPSLAQAAALAARGPTAPTPAVDPRAPDVSLAIELGDLRFPNWAWAFSLRAVGWRSDTLGGRRAVTVYYAHGAQRVAYTILAAPAIAIRSPRRTRLAGLTLWAATVRGHTVVSWHEDGETCLLQGSDITAARLRELAAWSAPSG